MPGVIESFVLLALTSAGLSGAALGIAVPTVVGAIGAVVSAGVSLLAASLFKPEQPKPEDVQVTIKSPTAVRQRHYGRVKASGPLAFLESKSGRLYKVIALGTGEVDAIEELWVDDQHVTIDEVGGVIEEPYGRDDGDSRLVLEYRLGLPTETHYSTLEAVFPEWDSTHRGDGVSSIYAVQMPVEAEEFTETFPNGTNTLYRVVLRGSKVYNPSTETTAWDENAGAVIRDYMTHADGMRLPSSLFTTTQATAGWLAAYNRCGLDIDKKAGGTEDAYRLWGTYKFDERPADVLGRMLQCCDGRIVPTPDGGVTLDVGTWAEPTVTIDEDSIVGFSEISRGRDIMTTANVISATYLSPTHDYQATDADQWRDEDDISARGEIVRDEAFNMSPSHGQARRLMKLAAYRANPNWIGTFSCNLKALAAFGKRFVRVSYPLFEIDEVFEVLDFRFNIGEGNILQGVTLQVASMPQEAYEWDAATEEGDEPISETVTVDRTIPAVGGFTFTEGTVVIGGENYPVGVITFDAPPSESLRVEGQYKKVSESETAWQVIPVAPGATSAQTGVLEDGAEYEARVRHVTITGRVGDWSDPTLKLTPISNPTPPEDLVSFSLTGSAPYLGNAPFSFTTQNDDNLRHVALYRVASGGVLDRETDLVLKIPVNTAASTYGYVDGDATRTDQAVNGDMSSATGWTVPADFTIGSGVATKVASAATRHLYQSVSPSGPAVKFRWALTVLNWVSYSFFVRISTSTGSLIEQSDAMPAANGTYVGTLTNGGLGAARIGPVGATNTEGDCDDFIYFEETAACAPQGAWDYYAEPLNPSGVAGTLEGPVAVTIV